MLIYVVKSSSRSFCRAWDRIIIGRDDSDRLICGLTQIHLDFVRYPLQYRRFLEPDPFRNPHVLLRHYFSEHPKEINPCCLNQVEPVHHAESINDQAPD
ncbi:hypothetical protein TNCV_4995081 [Trichonephila clavipes]|nr:hypothetical protein TNCV_4995081 [Trichonephila clavipes]